MLSYQRQHRNLSEDSLMFLGNETLSQELKEPMITNIGRKNDFIKIKRKVLAYYCEKQTKGFLQ